MSKLTNPNWPAKNGKKSGGGRGNNPPKISTPKQSPKPVPKK